MISTTAKYALRTVVYLARCESNYICRAEIAEATQVPHEYLLKVLKELGNAGLVESRRGPGGGYRLAKLALNISTLDVVLSVDQIPRIEECPLGITQHQQLCPLHKLMDNASRLVEEAFKGVSVADLVPKHKKKQTCNFPGKE